MGRPPSPRLSRPLIGQCALSLIDSHGDFSMPQLAENLGVAVSSLYHHVSGRADVVELVRHQVVAEIDLTSLDGAQWAEGLRVWLVSYHRAFARHPGAINLLATTTIHDPLSRDMYERCVRLLMRAGFARHEVVALMTAAESLVLGSALDSAAPSTMVTADGSTPALDLALADVGADRADHAFGIGLDVLIAGMRHRLEQSERRPALTAVNQF